MTGKVLRIMEETQVPAIYSQNVHIQIHPIESPCPSRQENSYFNFDSPAIASINTPIATLEHNIAREMSNLRPPKVRSRLTSTPNTSGICCTPEVKSLLDGDLKDLSPTGVNPIGNLSKVKSCLHKRPMVDDPKGVLFPQQNSHTGQAVCDESIQFQTKMDSNRETDVNSSHFQGNPSRNLGASFQDSGFESLGTSTFSQESVSFINSPIKRKAGGEITSVESPMKRLAFGTLQIQTTNALDVRDFEKRVANCDTSVPGCSFFCDKDERMDILETPPTPIFANVIQFSPPRSSKPISTDKNFAFTKPTVVPLRHRNARNSDRSIEHIPTSESNYHTGKRHFDIISHLAKRDLSHVITKIFSSMRPKDVFRSSHVSSSWALSLIHI